MASRAGKDSIVLMDSPVYLIRHRTVLALFQKRKGCLLRVKDAFFQGLKSDGTQKGRITDIEHRAAHLHLTTRQLPIGLRGRVVVDFDADDHFYL
jgi:hypothetical protein